MRASPEEYSEAETLLRRVAVARGLLRVQREPVEMPQRCQRKRTGLGLDPVEIAGRNIVIEDRALEESCVGGPGQQVRGSRRGMIVQILMEKLSAASSPPPATKPSVTN